MPKVAVTGANSDLGQLAVRYLAELPSFHITAITSPRGTESSLFQADNVQVRPADLTQPLDSRLTSELNAADRIFHFAWMRGREPEAVLKQNMAMIESLLQGASEPNRLVMISTVAAAPDAVSIYGRTKYAAMNQLVDRGGASAVCGLVVDDPPRGPYGLLRKCVRSFPFAVRCPGGGPPVYPINASDIGSACEAMTFGNWDSGHYRLFADPVSFNEFVRGIESDHPRFRIPIPLPARSIVRLTGLMRKLHLAPSGFADKIMTFLHKNAAYLDSHRQIEGFHAQPFGSATQQLQPVEGGR